MLLLSMATAMITTTFEKRARPQSSEANVSPQRFCLLWDLGLRGLEFKCALEFRVFSGLDPGLWVYDEGLSPKEGLCLESCGISDRSLGLWAF